jgi:hypothetical protein
VKASCLPSRMPVAYASGRIAGVGDPSDRAPVHPPPVTAAVIAFLLPRLSSASLTLLHLNLPLYAEVLP